MAFDDRFGQAEAQAIAGDDRLVARLVGTVEALENMRQIGLLLCRCLGW